jgi:hypothetical protein
MFVINTDQRLIEGNIIPGNVLNNGVVGLTFIKRNLYDSCG